MNELEQRIEKNPQDAEAYNNLAVFYDKKNDYAQALKNYAIAVNLEPGYMTAHYNLGLFFLKHSQLEEALKQFHNVIELDETQHMAHYYLGCLYLEKNALDLAEKHYAEMLNLCPENSDTWNNLGVIYLKKEEPQKAIDFFAKALAFNINHQDARNNLAATFMQYDRYENAARHYRELLREYPDIEEYHYNIAVAYMHLGHLDEAIEHFEFVLKNNPDHCASLNNLAVIFWRLNNKHKAEAFLMQIQEKNPHHDISRYMLSAIRHEKNFIQAPEEYIKNLFDNYAIQYNDHLCQELKYQLPQKIDALLQQFILPNSRNIVLDMGCGTGLLGNILGKFFKKICGVDLSQKMLDQAEKTGFYDRLICSEILHFLENTKDKFDCICAAEVLEYFGDLERLFQDVAEHLCPSGLFIFSIETTQEEKFILQETARFAHNLNYIQYLAKQNALQVLFREEMPTRLQNGQPLSSCLFFIKKT